MIVYRLAKSEYADNLSGIGSAIYGGRWNSKGVFVIYTGESQEICLLEFIAHAPKLIIPDISLITLEIPNSILDIKTKSLPKNWKSYPSPRSLAVIGDNWVKSKKSLSMKVPSCIIPTAFNYVINCNHKLIKRVKIKSIEKFDLDTRFLK